MANIATQLLNQAKVRAGWPTAGGFLTDLELLQLGNEELWTTVASLLRRASEEFWVVQAPDAPVSAASPDVRVPSRALGSAIRDVLITDGSTVWNAPKIDPEDAWRFRDSGPSTWRSPFAFYLEGSYLKLVPVPTNSDYSVRIKYFRRPGELIEATTTSGGVTTHHAGVVSSVDGSVVTLASAPPSTFVPTEKLDIIDGLTPHEAVSDDLTISSVDAAAKTVTLSSPPSSRVREGDYVALAGKSPVAQIPETLFPVLIMALVRAMHHASNDAPAARTAEEQLARRASLVLPLLEPRVTGERPVVINRTSALRGSGRRGW